MKTTLTLTTPLLKKGNRPAAIGAELGRSTAELERNIKTNIQRSRPAGRTYRRTALIRPSSKRTAGLKLVERSNGTKRVVGYQFHRASRRGQPPAIDTGGLINSIRGVRLNPLRYRIQVGKDYGDPLDDPNALDRPFFTSEVNKFRPTFLENIRRAFFRGGR